MNTQGPHARTELLTNLLALLALLAAGIVWPGAQVPPGAAAQAPEASPTAPLRLAADCCRDPGTP